MNEDYIERPATTESGAVSAYAGADIDAYRARFGKAEGERRFFAEHGHAAAAPERTDATIDDLLATVYLDTSDC